MAVSQARKKANKKWDAANMQNLSVKIRRTYADEIRAACKEAGTTPAAIMRAALDSFMESRKAAGTPDPDGIQAGQEEKQ